MAVPSSPSESRPSGSRSPKPRATGPSGDAGTGPSGRYTPKKTDKRNHEKGREGTEKEPAYKSSGRYTPPIPMDFRVSPVWVPFVMFALLLVGLFTIILNYLEVLPGAATNWYLLLGLGFITGGFFTATQLR